MLGPINVDKTYGATKSNLGLKLSKIGLVKEGWRLKNAGKTRVGNQSLTLTKVAVERRKKPLDI